MDESTLNDSTFTLVEEDTNRWVPASVTYNSKNKEARLEPASKLACETRYKVTIKSGSDGAKGSDGKALSEEKVWSFRVRRMIPMSSVILLSIALLTVTGASLMQSFDPALPTKVVQVERDLPAFTTVAPPDVAYATVIWPPTRYVKPPTDPEKPNPAEGRITTAPLQRGTILTESSAVEVENDWRLLRIPSSSTLSPSAGEKVVLLGVKSGSSEDAAVHLCTEAVVLGRTEKQTAAARGAERTTSVPTASEKDEQIMVALPPEDARRAAPYLLGDSRLLILEKTE